MQPAPQSHLTSMGADGTVAGGNPGPSGATPPPWSAGSGAGTGMGMGTGTGRGGGGPHAGLPPLTQDQWEQFRLFQEFLRFQEWQRAQQQQAQQQQPQKGDCNRGQRSGAGFAASGVSGQGADTHTHTADTAGQQAQEGRVAWEQWQRWQASEQQEPSSSWRGSPGPPAADAGGSAGGYELAPGEPASAAPRARGNAAEDPTGARRDSTEQGGGGFASAAEAMVASGTVAWDELAGAPPPSAPRFCILQPRQSANTRAGQRRHLLETGERERHFSALSVVISRRSPQGPEGGPVEKIWDPVRGPRTVA